MCVWGGEAGGERRLHWMVVNIKRRGGGLDCTCVFGVGRGWQDVSKFVWVCVLERRGRKKVLKGREEG